MSKSEREKEAKMSQFSKVKVIIKNVEVFKEACEKHQISYSINRDPAYQMRGAPVHAILRDTIGSSEAYLCVVKNGFQLTVDNDSRYSSITKRLGANGALLMRSYSEGMTRKLIRTAGGRVKQISEQEDKSLLIRVMVP